MAVIVVAAMGTMAQETIAGTKVRELGEQKNKVKYHTRLW